MAVLPRLTTLLDRTFRVYGSRHELPLYLTEYGYQTAPDPLGVPPLDQGAFLNQSEWMAMRNPRVKAFGQFLLVDDGPPITITFQTGLINRRGQYKASFPAYRLPVWVTGRGSRRRVWALLRPAATGARAKAEVQYRAVGARTYRTLRTVTSTGRRNVVRTTVTAARGGSLRVAYGELVSRTVKLR
jgi:hypothetical protein